MKIIKILKFLELHKHCSVPNSFNESKHFLQFLVKTSALIASVSF